MAKHRPKTAVKAAQALQKQAGILETYVAANKSWLSDPKSAEIVKAIAAAKKFGATSTVPQKAS